MITKNKKTVKKLPIELNNDTIADIKNENSAQQNNPPCTITYYTEFNEKVSFNTGDVIKLEVIVKDNYGFQYKKIIDSQRIDKNGNANPNNISDEFVIE